MAPTFSPEAQSAPSLLVPLQGCTTGTAPPPPSSSSLSTPSSSPLHPLTMARPSRGGRPGADQSSTVLRMTRGDSSAPGSPCGSPGAVWVDPNYLHMDLAETKRRHSRRRGSSLGNGEVVSGDGAKKQQRAERSQKLRVLLRQVESGNRKI